MNIDNKKELIDHLITYGKTDDWYNLAVKFNIGEGLNRHKRGKKANDIWRTYNRNKTNVSSIVSSEELLDLPGTARLKSVWGKEGSYQKSYVVDLKTEEIEKRIKLLKEDLISEVKKHAPKYERVRYKQFGEEKLLEISIYDHHFGKLGWGEEVDEDYDIKIATKRFREAVEYFADLGKSLGVSKILFVVGNDLFNTDGNGNTTTAGTPQDVDVRWQKAFSTVRKVVIESIDKFRTICPVDIVVVPGNHDRSQCYYLGEVLDCWYHNCHEVNVDNSPKLRKYYRYGANLIGYTHGNEEKITDLPMIMATEAPKDFAETKYREIHIGHWHQNRVMEQYGIVTRILPSLTGTDFWHKSKGYVGNMKSAQAHIYSKTDGFIAFFQYNL